MKNSNRITAILMVLMMGTVTSPLVAVAGPKPGVDSKAGQPKDLPKEGWVVQPDVATELEGYKEALWGMSPDQVRTAMPEKAFEEREGGFGYKSMYYKDDIAGETAMVNFMFRKNELEMVAMKFDVANWVDDAPVEKFDKFLSILTDKYGRPLVLKRDVPDAHLDDPAGAIKDGVLEFESNWQTAGTKITLKLESTKTRLDRKKGFDFRILYRAVSIAQPPKKEPGADL